MFLAGPQYDIMAQFVGWDTFIVLSGIGFEAGDEECLVAEGGLRIAERLLKAAMDFNRLQSTATLVVSKLAPELLVGAGEFGPCWIHRPTRS
jgi:hypothetical protein